MAKSSSNGVWQHMQQHNFWLESRPHAKGFKARRYLGFLFASTIELSPVPARKYGLKYAAKWPHCTNIRCMGGSMKQFQKACDGSKGCIGFSLSANKSAGNGCLKKFPCNTGFGKGTVKGKGARAGLRVLLDGKEAAWAPSLQRLEVPL